MKILLVEDDPQVADTLARLMRIDHHEVELARDGLEALERVGATEYDAILCDIRMPRLDGPGFYAALGRSHPHLIRRTAFVTADSESPDVRQFFAATRTLWIPKPAGLAELRQVLQRLTGH